MKRHDASGVALSAAAPLASLRFLLSFLPSVTHQFPAAVSLPFLPLYSLAVHNLNKRQKRSTTHSSYNSAEKTDAGNCLTADLA